MRALAPNQRTALCPHGRSRRATCLRAQAYGDPSLDTDDCPRVRVRLSVPFRVPKRQMLCVGGDKLPFGWSFMSIAHVPMTWNPGDIWSVEVRAKLLLSLQAAGRGITGGLTTTTSACTQVDLKAGERIQYKYVILEEQVWS